jgi:hypothetical protein
VERTDTESNEEGARKRLFVCIVVVGLIACSPAGWRAAAAQSASLISIDDIIQQNEDLGAGCNAIGLSLPMIEEGPESPTQDWIDEHAACLDSGLRTAGGCYGLTDGQQQFALCLFTVLNGDGATTIDCDQFTLETFTGTYGVSRSDTDEAVTAFQQAIAQRNLDQLGFVQSCAQPAPLATKTAMLAVFAIPPTDKQVGLKVNVGPAQYVVLISDGPAIRPNQGETGA